MGLWVRRLLAALVVVGAGAAVVYVAFPEVILRAITARARHAAGLERHSVQAAGHHMAYLDGGSGSPVVLLHSFAASKDLWNAVAARLTARYRVIAPDIPGFGESPARGNERYDAASQAVRIRAFLGALGVRDHHIGGHSMGGVISAVYAAAYPDAVRSLLISAAPGVRSPQKTAAARRVEAGDNPLLVGDESDFDMILHIAFFRPPSIPGPVKRAIVRTAMRNRANYARIFDDLAQAGESALEPLLPSIATRTLVAWGAEDRLVHPSSVDVFTAAIAGSESAIFPECGHAIPRECPELLAERYLAFLASTQ